MKYILCSFFCLQIILGSATAQKHNQIKCFYNLNFQVDSTDVGSKKSEKMVLYLNTNGSKFSSLHNLQFEDSLKAIMVNIVKTTGKYDFTGFYVPRTNFYWQIFKSSKRTITYDKLLGEFYQYEEEESISWEIKNEKNTIQGYNCQKATGSFGGRDYIAWFTYEIPISDGPYKFKGLPGLIVKITDTRDHYDFELVSIKKDSKYDIKKSPETYHNATKKEVFDLYKYKRENPIQYIDQMATMQRTPEKEREIIERAKRNNNPIELDY